MNGGSRQEFGPGEISLLPSRIQRVGGRNDPAVVVDISGRVDFARPHAR